MSWKLWFHGLAAAVIGGAATGAVNATNANADLHSIGVTSAAGAIVTVLGYFLKSPIFQQSAPPQPPAPNPVPTPKQ